MTPKSKLSRQQVEEMAKRRRAGETYQSLASIYGLSKTGVIISLRRAGLYAPGYLPCIRKKMSEQNLARISQGLLISASAGKLKKRQKYAISSGWPQDLYPIQVAILNLLVANGPMTEIQMMTKLNVTKHGLNRRRVLDLHSLGLVARSRKNHRCCYIWAVTLTALNLWRKPDEEKTPATCSTAATTDNGDDRGTS